MKFDFVKFAELALLYKKQYYNYVELDAKYSSALTNKQAEIRDYIVDLILMLNDHSSECKEAKTFIALNQIILVFGEVLEEIIDSKIDKLSNDIVNKISNYFGFQKNNGY